MKPARPAALPPAPPPPAGTRGGGAHGLPEGAPVPIAQPPRPPAPGPGGGPTHPTLEPRLGFCRMGRWHRLQAVLPLRASQRAFPFPRPTKAVLGENSENTICLSATWTAAPGGARRGAGGGARDLQLLLIIIIIIIVRLPVRKGKHRGARRPPRWYQEGGVQM